MAVRTVVAMSIIGPAYRYLDGVSLITALGASLSAGSVIGAWVLARRIRDGLPSGTERLAPSVVRTVGGAVAMSGPAYFVATHLTLGGRQPSEVVATLAAALLGLVVFVGFQRLSGSVELTALANAIRQAGRGREDTIR